MTRCKMHAFLSPAPHILSVLLQGNHYPSFNKEFDLGTEPGERDLLCLHQPTGNIPCLLSPVYCVNTFAAQMTSRRILGIPGHISLEIFPLALHLVYFLFSSQYILTYGYKDKLNFHLILTLPSVILNFPLGSFQPNQKESLQN